MTDITPVQQDDLQPFDPTQPNALDQFVQQNFATVQRIRAEVAEQARQLEQASRENTIREFAELLRTELGDALADALDLHYSIYDSGNVWATFKDGESEFAIRREPDNSRSRIDTPWRIFSPLASSFRKEYDSSSAGGEVLQAHIAIAIATVRQRREDDARMTKERVEKERQSELDRLDNQRRRDEDRTIEFAAETVEHERLKAQIDQARATLLASAWQWPLNIMLTYYEIQWCAGAVRDDDGNLMTDMQKAWTLTDSLAAGGYITIYTRYGAARTVKFDLHEHKPTWERFSATRVEDLPMTLRENLTLRVNGIGEFWVAEVKGRYFRVQEGESYWEQLGDYALPIAWVREALS